MLVTQVTCRLHNQSLQLLAPPQTRGCHRLLSVQAAPSGGRGRLRRVHNPSHCVHQSTSSLDHSSKGTQQPPGLSCVLNWKKEKKKSCCPHSKSLVFTANRCPHSPDWNLESLPSLLSSLSSLNPEAPSGCTEVTCRPPPSLVHAVPLSALLSPTLPPMPLPWNPVQSLPVGINLSLPRSP